MTMIFIIRMIGFLALLLLIWFVGPLISIAHYQPLFTVLNRLICITLLVLLWLGIEWLQSRKAKKANQQLIDGLSGTAGSSDNTHFAVDDELQKLDKDFSEALQLLNQASASGKKSRNALYKLPWYIIIGPPGSGKTTLLSNSGLDFPLADKYADKAVQGVGGTRHCDWWFANQAVLIDTAGRYTTQDSHQQVDQGAWAGFLDLLKKNRPRRPVNGAFIALSLADFLLLPEQELKAHALAIKSRIQELNDKLGIKIPVYMLFTKCDLIAGFNEFYDDLDSEERMQVWGQTFPVGKHSDNVIDSFALEYQALMQRLDDRLLKRLQEERDIKNRSLMFGFPRQMEALEVRVIAFLKAIFSVNRYQDTFFLRGVYFTSGTQEGTPIDQLMGSLAQSYGLDRQETPLFSGKGRSYFITRLLNDVVFKESELVGFDQKKEQRRNVLQYSLYALSGLLLLALSGLWLTSFSNNQAKIETQQAAINAYDQPVKQSRWQLDFNQLLPRMNALQAAKDDAFKAQDNWLSKAGLYQGDKLKPAAQAAYERFLLKYFLPAIRYRFEERLQDAIVDNNETLYELLKTYLMLNNLEQRHTDLLKAWVSIDWELDYANQPEFVNQLNTHLDYLLALQTEGIKLNTGLVANARRQLTRIPQAHQIYSRIKSETATNHYHMDVQKMMGPHADRVFVNASGELEQLTIPGLYTRQGYQNLFLKHAANIIKQAVEQDWVLNRTKVSSSSVTDLAALRNEIQDLYILDYIRYWDHVLANAQLRPTTQIEETTELLGYISGKSSPFKQFLSTVTENTQLSKVSQQINTAVNASESGTALDTKTQTALNALKNKVKNAGFVANVEAIDKHFVAIHKLTGGAADQTSEVNLLIEQFANIYTAMIKMQGGAGILGPSAAKQSNNMQLTNQLQRLQVELSRLPEPVSEWTDGITKRVNGELSNDVKKQLDQVWSEVVVQCKVALEGQYPFSKGSSRDVNLMDFGRFFARQGILDNFFQQNLQAYVDTSKASWRLTKAASETLSVSQNSLRQFQYASIIRDKYFKAQGSMPVLRFSIKPLLKSADIAKVMLEIDGQNVEFDGGMFAGKQFTWPGSGAGGYVKVAFEFADGRTKTVYQIQGPWALFRFLDLAVTGPLSNNSDRFTIRLNHAISYAKFEVLTGGGINPFNTREMKNFRCPRRI